MSTMPPKIAKAYTKDALSLDLSIPQSDFFVSTLPSVAVIAGFGSGKTFTLWMKLFSWMVQYPGVMHGYFAPTYSLIRDILYPTVAEWCEAAGIGYTIKRADGIIYIHGYGSIICRTMNKPERIVGFEIGCAAIDEIDIMPTAKAWLAWRKIKARCRIRLPNGAINQMALASTPEGFKMAYEAFKKSPIPSSQLIQMSTYSNQHNLPDNYIQDLLDNYPPELVKAYLLGEFTNLVSGTVYSSFDRYLNNAPGHFPLPTEHLHIGMDFNVRKMCGIVHVIRGGAPIAVDELIQILDTPAMITTIREKYPKNVITIYPDASGKSGKTVNAGISDIKLLKQANFYVKANDSNPFVKDRVNSMNVNFSKSKYWINVDRCPHYTETLEQQVYDKNGAPDKDHDTDHPNDAAGYFINYMFGINKPETFQTALPHA